MGQRSRLKQVRRKAVALVQVQQTPEQRLNAVSRFLEYRIFNRKQAREVLAAVPADPRKQNLNRE